MEGLEAEDELLESMDSGVIGNVYHNTMETLYKSCGSRVSSAWLESAIKDKKGIASLVDEQTCKEMHTESVTGRDIIICAIITRYVLATLKRDLEMLKESGRDSFAVIALEKNFRTRFHGLDFKGRVDRLDSFNPGELRLVDYKTGRGDIMKMASLSDVFSHDKVEKHSNYFLQAMLYSIIVRNSQKYNSPGHSVMPAVLYVQNLRRSDYSPYLQIDKKEISDVGTYEEEYLWNMRMLIEEIFNTDIPFVPNGTAADCKRCRFRNLCGM